MRIRLPISVTDRSQITNLPVDTQILKGRTTWRNPPSIFLILRDFDYLPRFFSFSTLVIAPAPFLQSSLLLILFHPVEEGVVDIEDGAHLRRVSVHFPRDVGERYEDA